MNLYNDYAEEFSKTRQIPWKGWQQILEELKTITNPLTILDLGCGNGRFLKYLADRNIRVKKYIGVDTSNLLLSQSKHLVEDMQTMQMLQESEIKNVDLNSADWLKSVDGTFNFVSAFGIMHHINPFETRKAFLKNAFEKLEKGGILAVTYWQFGNLERYNAKKSPLKTNKDTMYWQNDFQLNFGKDAKRFCHFVNEAELAELEAGLEFKDSKTFVSDGRDDNENIYRLYFK